MLEVADLIWFAVIIGNPPYVEYHKVRDRYRILDFATEPCGNLYAYAKTQLL